ncbi:MerR family transcriptional regulator [Endozoicomonas atrinae]|uniref:MerR family transcriptional regulator n=1 Tax=Endozoicomonas atrinae TaxID=1333660 RepID=UPI003B00CA69
MLTVTQLARKYDISRTTILYYEREGLLMPHTRSENSYRWYGQTEIKRLEAIMAYRAFGIPVSNIAPLLNREDDREQERIL